MPRWSGFDGVAARSCERASKRVESLLRLEKATAERVFGLSEEQTRMLERLSSEFRGIIERFYHTLLDEHFGGEGSKNRFETIDEM